MTPKLYRVTVRSEMVVLAYTHASAEETVREDYDAQYDCLKPEDATSTLLKRENMTQEALKTFPYVSRDVTDKVKRACEAWFQIIEAEEKAKNDAEAEFRRKQLALPGIDP